MIHSSAQTGADYGCWSAEGSRLRIEYDPSVLEEICAIAVDGLYRLRHGGVEVGGVLYGEHETDLVRILAFRQLDCEHVYGPRFILSERDRSSFRQFLDAPRHDTELRGMAPVGWYHSHTRSGIALSPRDLEIHNSYFPQSWQVALVLRPESFGPARAGFFLRQGGESIRAGASPKEFVIARRRRIEPTVPDPDQQQQDTPAPVHAGSATPAPDALPASDGTLPAAAPGTELRVLAGREPERSRKWAWLMAALCLVAGGGYRIERYSRFERAAPLSLSVAEVDGQMRIEWNRTAAPVRQARYGTIDIQDGSRRAAVRMDPQHLRTGSFAYPRRSEMVHVRLRLELPFGRSAEELICFVGRPVPPAEAAVYASPLQQRE